MTNDLLTRKTDIYTITRPVMGVGMGECKGGWGWGSGDMR